MMQRLHLRVVQIMLYGTIATVGAQVSIRPWGRFIDRYGNKPEMMLIMLASGVFMPDGFTMLGRYIYPETGFVPYHGNCPVYGPDPPFMGS